MEGRCQSGDTVRCAAKPLQGIVALGDPLSAVQKVFDADNVGVVAENGKIVGIITKIDVVEFLAARS